ncbi:hypothetical protein [Planctopirus hydrillae]|uniref:Uncharacterized protein n=1 Tax=Planctopirus hydrillae TaxID=1841610 RepID=A0A1C3ECW8_9PLAN|nr:hypothetical protein [Planctopirus hydrillae]ODA31088.1 hypothetical protein A6X21_23145 [Planctopirus hydrillae]
MFMLLALLSFLVLVSCLVIRRERVLRQAWQHLAAQILSRRNTPDASSDVTTDQHDAGFGQ